MNLDTYNLDCFSAFSDARYVDPVVAANARAQADPNYYAPASGVFMTANQVLPSIIASTLSNKMASNNLAKSLKAAAIYVKAVGQSGSTVQKQAGGLQQVNTSSGGTSNTMPIMLLVGGGMGIIALVVLMSRHSKTTR